MKKKTGIILLIGLSAIITGVVVYQRYQAFYNSPEQVKKRQEAEYAAQRKALKESRKELQNDTQEEIADKISFYHGEYATYQVTVSSDLDKTDDGYFWNDSVFIVASANSNWKNVTDPARYKYLYNAASEAKDVLQTKEGWLYPDEFEENYYHLSRNPEQLTCYKGKVSYQQLIDVKLDDGENKYHLTLTDTDKLYDNIHYFVNGTAIDPDSFPTQDDAQASSSNSSTSSDQGGAINPSPAQSSDTGNSYKQSGQNQNSGNTGDDDEYHVNDYDDPEDFYEDNADDFEDEEDAEDYYDEYHD
ncbi:MAG: hypothetical protein ACI4ET_07500 [Bilifractor sp.]